MKKTNDAKKANRIARKINNELKQDVFGNRFEILQIQKIRCDNMEYFRYKMVDHIQLDRVKETHWLNIYELQRKLSCEMNDFIISSNFWEKYREENH